MTAYDITGIVLAVIGAWLFYHSRKRVFDRRNAFGQEVFDSYGGKLVAHLIDWTLLGIGFFLAFTGLLVLAFEHQDSWGWIVILPVAWLLIVGYVPLGKR